MEFSHFFLTFVSRKENKTMANKKLWVRLGGYVEGTAQQMEEILDGNEEVLLEVLRTNGFTLSGETYVPETETEFDIETQKL